MCGFIWLGTKIKKISLREKKKILVVLSAAMSGAKRMPVSILSFFLSFSLFVLFKWITLQVGYILARDESRQMRGCSLLPLFLSSNDLYVCELCWCTYTDGGGALYVWPQRLADDEIVQGTNERHYRRRRDLVWHPHPSYQLTLQVFHPGNWLRSV